MNAEQQWTGVALSTNLNFKQPPNTLIFTTDYDILTANYTSEKVTIDKKTKKVVYKCFWVLSAWRDGKMLLYGSLETDLEATNDAEAEDRIAEISNHVARFIETARDIESSDNSVNVLSEHNGREIIAAVHARFLSQFLHSTKLEHSILAVRAFLKTMNVKNTKKILADVFDAKIIEDIKDKDLK
jgi:hypothetical protein